VFDEEVAQGFFDHTVLIAQLKQRVSNEHFSVDGTLLEAWGVTCAALRVHRSAKVRCIPASYCQDHFNDVTAAFCIPALNSHGSSRPDTI
jgi:hypothetical protein